MQNEFGGLWTETKINILYKYASAYLFIMNKQKFHLTYFDGFAGSGEIKIGNEKDFKIIEGAAQKVVGITMPRGFDIYYFVEKDQEKKRLLEFALKTKRPTNNIFVVAEDCNIVLKRLAAYLQKDSFRKALIFLDPFGMNLDWSSIEILKGLGVDLWVLSPTGVGANRLLKKDLKISEAWWLRLEKFFGIDRQIITNSIYDEEIVTDLFGPRKVITKSSSANDKLFKIYSEKLNTVFDLISDPYVIVNSNNSLMYHFFCASNNVSAIKIANDLVKSHNKKKT
ncbi:three-Cys-motif partner protein TcmP [Pedobacter sp. ISL-68]|uniref:three-Cys-motif partner protein TcmP n=1 Tax=unclassified Pedobacter TaxID=2628915 RepID=UPI001BE5DA10|nr:MULTISPECIES: three-Cys-motif partner protein TcmP [unclassified Pedobacter]MBT2563032.1 three-Cys-motif partner protein TcmP [Pedobacter sp. ISL-64]MBT2593036.1 three-Cys-motif partner protein TcmP [Pedobacter sp. ISL-68]